MSDWQDISTAPRDGTPFIGSELFRYLPYKPQAVRQTGKHGRFQKWNGYGWENCEPPGSWQPASDRVSRQEEPIV
jgi:hypothetical protein